jgi:hypothetical protein
MRLSKVPGENWIIIIATSVLRWILNIGTYMGFCYDASNHVQHVFSQLSYQLL